jgi:thiol-disulfide isomerase/thioredoxin
MMRHLIMSTTLACAVAMAVGAVPVAAAAGDLYAAAGVQPVRDQAHAPAFVLNTLEGQPLDSASLRHKVIMVNFWATWCGPCKDELPSLQRLKQSFKAEEFELLAITTDQQREAIVGFVRSLGLAFPILLDEAKDVSAAFGVRGLPTTFLIGKDGRLLARAVGPRAWDSPASVALIRSVMEPGP